MTGFTVHDGWITETEAHELAAWYHEICPAADMRSFETHLMVLRAYGTLAKDSPLELIAGLSRPRYNILRLLYQAEERRLLMSEFAQGMNVSPTNITKLIDSLVADGLVRRVTHDIDKRKTWAQLTEHGAQLVETTLPHVAEHVDGLWQCLEDEEKLVLTHLLAKLRLHALSVTAEAPAEHLRQFAAIR